jgi:hypothetical protein
MSYILSSFLSESAKPDFCSFVRKARDKEEQNYTGVRTVERDEPLTANFAGV